MNMTFKNKYRSTHTHTNNIDRHWTKESEWAKWKQTEQMKAFEIERESEWVSEGAVEIMCDK